MSMEYQDWSDIHDCVVNLRNNHHRRKEKVYIGCGAGFGGDRPSAALKLLQRVKELDYLVLECLAERTLADRYQAMSSGGDGYDSRISDWMSLLLPLAVESGTCIITNMGAMDPLGAQERVLETACNMGLTVSVAVAHELSSNRSGSGSQPRKSNVMESGISTYLGAAPIVECLEKYQPNVIITSRIADAALFLAPMIYELGWNWDDLKELAQGSLAGHLLECGCQLTGGYFMHPGDKYRDMSLPSLLDLSLPYAEISFDGQVCVAKAESSGGVLNFSTCAQQLLYEVGDPGAYITPDVVIDLRDVSFHPLSSCRVLCTGAKSSMGSWPDKLLRLVPKSCGWKGWGEISYGGYECVARAKAAEYLVRSWMEEVCPGVSCNILSYIIGLDSLKANVMNDDTSVCTNIQDIRLRMDGLFELKEQAVQFTREFTALYTNGPAGGGGISTGCKKEIVLEKQLVGRENVFWQTGVRCSKGTDLNKEEIRCEETVKTCEATLSKSNRDHCHKERNLPAPASAPAPAGENVFWQTGVRCSKGRDSNKKETRCEEAVKTSSRDDCREERNPPAPAPAPAGKKIPLYSVAHSRAGDKGNDMNFSIIPHYAPDIERLKKAVTPLWVKGLLVVSNLCSKKWVDEEVSVEIYEVKGINSLNVVVRNVLDGGVNCSRRIDRHGKTISDLVLSHHIVLPPP
ncbi:uncharacterized protein [Euphorbia lathyris]|uniref:uncharacterized protein isoform X1 n=1 Tax=Euphorbia lathyris TaxID=212925 RepID=UPI003313FF69